MLKTNYQNLIRRAVWQPVRSTALLSVPEAWHTWLMDRGSLTTRLTEYASGEFRVRLLSERWARPWAYEARKLELPPHACARIREVELLCSGIPVVFARSVLPLEVILRNKRTLVGMGEKPLGHLLFKSGRLRRNRRDITQIKTNNGTPVFGRATVYEYNRQDVLVQEFFVNHELIE